jgi:hypothetical protein
LTKNLKLYCYFEVVFLNLDSFSWNIRKQNNKSSKDTIFLSGIDPEIFRWEYLETLGLSLLPGTFEIGVG